MNDSDVDKIEVVLNFPLLQTYFMQPLHEAANALGMCSTALKRSVFGKS
jgi:hypothetical protein